MHGDADVSGGIITDSTLPSLLEPSPVPHESLPLVESASSSSGARQLHVEAQPLRSKRKRDEDLDSADVSFEGAWFASRKKARGGQLAELASLRDIVGLMQTKKSNAAEKHLDDRINVWLQRYAKKKPKDCALHVPEFSSRKGGGSGGIGVTKDFASAIYEELTKQADF